MLRYKGADLSDVVQTCKLNELDGVIVELQPSIDIPKYLFKESQFTRWQYLQHLQAVISSMQEDQPIHSNRETLKSQKLLAKLTFK